MSISAFSPARAVQLLRRRDPALTHINLEGSQLTDAELSELADCLLAHPDVATIVWLGYNQLTDETGVKLARYLAASSTVKSLVLSSNQLGSATYLAVAAALRVNSSLGALFLNDSHEVDQTRIDAAFVDTLRLNPNRSADSMWYLYSSDLNDFKRLKRAADRLGHPSLQMLLLTSDRWSAARDSQPAVSP